jgi:hypothetical protein
MKTKIQYEWCIEHENKNGDIIDLDFADKLAEYGASSFKINRGCIKATLHLVRNEYTDDEGIHDRTYAYENADGDLEFGDWRPAGDFDDAMVWRNYPNMTVPKKLKNEFIKFKRQAGAK